MTKSTIAWFAINCSVAIAMATALLLNWNHQANMLLLFATCTNCLAAGYWARTAQQEWLHRSLGRLRYWKRPGRNRR